jgi:hypothetical protein
MAEFESCDKCKHGWKTENDYPCNTCKHGVNIKDFFTPKTNADAIREMSDEELAEFLLEKTSCTVCSYGKDGICYCGYGKNCDDGVLQWLKSEAKE